MVDLSADFRLRDVDTYAEWCGAPPSLASYMCRDSTAYPRPLRDSMTAPPRVSNPGITRVGPLSRYGGEHKAKELQKEAVYGLTELNREAIRLLMYRQHRQPVSPVFRLLAVHMCMPKVFCSHIPNPTVHG